MQSKLKSDLVYFQPFNVNYMIPGEFEYEDKSNGFVWLVLCCLTGIVSLCIIFLSCHPAKRITRVRVTVENKAEIEVYTKTDSTKLKSR